MCELLNCLFEPDDLIEFRALLKAKDVKRWFCTAAGSVQITDTLRQASAEGRHIFFGVNPRKRRGGKAADVALARALFADIEDVTPEQASERIAQAGLPVPTALLSSGHGAHAYWRLVEMLTNAMVWRDAQQALAALLASDPVVYDPPRCGRLPGYLNHKAPPAMCRLIDADPGRRYRLGDLLPQLGQTGQATENTESNEKAESAEKAEKNEVVMASSVSVSHCSLLQVAKPQIDFAIGASLPAGEGQRHRQVFKLARALKAIPEVADLPARALKPAVREWHRQALPVIRTKPFDDTWADFTSAWPNVQYPLGMDRLDGIVEAIRTKTPPPEAGEYDSPEVKLLVGLLAELQRQAGDAPIYLNTRKAGELLGVNFSTVARWMGMLEEDALLELVEKWRRNRCTRWRWRGRP